MVDSYPYLMYAVFNPTRGHGLPREVLAGRWREGTTERQKYEEYLPPGEISKYMSDRGEFLGPPNNVKPKKDKQHGSS